MEESISVNVVNAYALEPGKVYVFVVDKTKVSDVLLQHLGSHLRDLEIRALFLKTSGGSGVQIVEAKFIE